MVTKTYKLLFGQTFLSLIGDVNEKSIIIEFSGGKQTPPRPGRFMTNKPSIQKYVESHPWYGKRFILETEVGMHELPSKVLNHVEGATPTTKNLFQSSVPMPEPPDTPDTAEDAHDLPLKGRSVEEVYSGRTAKDWMIANVEGVTAGELKNNEQIRAIAEQHKLEFPNWK
jgi:hypothetical protein